MKQVNSGQNPMKLIEIIFDAAYLIMVLLSGILLYAGAGTGSETWFFGIMALILGIGDSFHLIPRMYALWNKGTQAYPVALGIGKLVTSITMTAFYVLLWHIGLLHYGRILPSYMTAVVYMFAVLRIILCIFPQNRWTSKEASLKWGIWRNIPFLALGICVMILFAKGSVLGSDGLSFMWLAVFISFLCYIPVVLFSKKNPKLGMLMMPKSCAYAAMVLMGFM